MEVKRKPSDKKYDRKEFNDKLCRLCASSNANIPIFPDKNYLKTNNKGLGLPLVCKIMSSVNIQVRRDDGLPTNICSDCATKVESTYEFLRLCERSDSFLRQYLDFSVNFDLIVLRRLIQDEDESDDSLTPTTVRLPEFEGYQWNGRIMN